jgi:serine/threonine protein kinase
MFNSLQKTQKESNFQNNLNFESLKNTQITHFLSSKHPLSFKPIQKTVLERKYQNNFGFSKNKQIEVELFDKIGEGGFGQVYRGREIHSNQNVAVKYSQMTISEISKSSIEKEIQISKKISELKIEGLLNILSCRLVQIKNQYFIETVMELGVASLKEILSQREMQNRFWTEQELLKMLGSMSNCLYKLGKEGVNHRDISIHNFVLSQNLETYKLIDFGHCYLFSEKERDCIIGKWNYMAPELKQVLFSQKKLDEQRCNSNSKSLSKNSIFEQNSSFIDNTYLVDPNFVSLNYTQT